MVSDIIEILTSGITEYGQGFAEGFGNVLKELFMKKTTTGTGDSAVTTYSNELSDTGKIIVTFAAISLAVGVCYVAVKFITSLGAVRP